MQLVLDPSYSRFLCGQVQYLEYELGIPRGRLKSIIMALPWLLSYSVDDNLKPKVRHVNCATDMLVCYSSCACKGVHFIAVCQVMVEPAN